MFEEVNRRNLLRGVMALAGVAASPSAFAQGLRTGAAALPTATMALVSAIADTMIPATDTPGALKAGVPLSFGKLLANWASETQKTHLLSAIDAIDAEARKVKGAGFVALSKTARFEMLDGYDKALTGGPDYARLKDLLVALYYLSEIGATVELRYEHVPGAWEPSLPVTAQTRTYATPTGA